MEHSPPYNIYTYKILREKGFELLRILENELQQDKYQPHIVLDAIEPDFILINIFGQKARIVIEFNFEENGNINLRGSLTTYIEYDSMPVKKEELFKLQYDKLGNIGNLLDEQNYAPHYLRELTANLPMVLSKIGKTFRIK